MKKMDKRKKSSIQEILRKTKKLTIIYYYALVRSFKI